MHETARSLTSNLRESKMRTLILIKREITDNLGYFIGPDSHLQEWPAATTEFDTRLLNLLRVTEGLMATVTLHNIQASPVLFYLAQLREMPPSLFKLQDDMVELLSRGPRKWLPTDAAYNIDKLFQFPGRFTRLRDMDIAIKARTGTSGKITWRQQHRALLDLRWHDDQTFAPLAGDWHNLSAVMTLHRAYEHTVRALPSLSGDDLLGRSQTAIYDLLRAAAGPPIT